MGEIKKKIKTNSSLRLDELQIREYQINIANNCAYKNSLVILPTGLGKTIIAVLVACKALELFPPNSKIIILAPTRKSGFDVIWADKRDIEILSKSSTRIRDFLRPWNPLIFSLSKMLCFT